MARPLHLFSRDGVFYWRRRLPRALARGAGPDHLCRSLDTADRSLARLRALRLSAVFEEVLLSHAATLRSAKPLTKHQREQVLFALYDQILEECQEWATGRTFETEQLDPEHVDWQMDRYNHPSRQVNEWTFFYQHGDYKGAEAVLKPLLASHATPGHTAGHAVNLETASTYYGGAEIPQLKEAVEQFDFGLRLEEVSGEWQIVRYPRSGSVIQPQS